ncbi:MAG: hypothetical protein WDN07_05410 [Actinomycetota bacterium]
MVQLTQPTTALNAMGWNPADNYLYALSSTTALQRIASDGTLTSAGAVTGVTVSDGAAFLTNDKMVVVSSSAATAATMDLLSLTRSSGTVNGGTGAAITLTNNGTTAYAGAGDIAIFPGAGGTYLGYALHKQLLTIFTFPNSSPTTATYITKTITGLQNGTSEAAFGAQWLDSQGNFYAFDNTTTSGSSPATWALYAINSTDLASAATSVAANKLAETTFPSITHDDGANCITAPSPFAPQLTTFPTVSSITQTFCECNWIFNYQRLSS